MITSLHTSLPLFSHLHWTSEESHYQNQCCSVFSIHNLHCPPNWNNWRPVDKDKNKDNESLKSLTWCTTRLYWFDYNKRTEVPGWFFEMSKPTMSWSPSFSAEERWGLPYFRQTQKHEFKLKMFFCLRNDAVGRWSNYLCLWTDSLQELITHLTVPQRHKWVLKEREKEAEQRVDLGTKQTTCTLTVKEVNLMSWLDDLSVYSL